MCSITKSCAGKRSNQMQYKLMNFIAPEDEKFTNMITDCN